MYRRIKQEQGINVIHIYQTQQIYENIRFELVVSHFLSDIPIKGTLSGTPFILNKVI